ncbi:heme lyase CcmF/NrfE family subunit [Variovorax sp. J22R133]|uniref:heme lyase CcmF/NrfE family subunit n=1 Tax=Variovorax brevis TaxID=3053503 RepID=UPI0025755860|nr:heme lyase CcmF/NrfE family subunit [Variovorax sp. J22R133]MDM0113779.1 heme lyase CcmF/NrfE family subunit [Variovorax sp. J22R133]
MIPELGHLALVLALSMALVQAFSPWVRWQRGGEWAAFARPAAQAQFVFVVLAFAALTQCFLQNDFSVLYVAQHSNSALPTVYRVTAVWGGHEGSILLWTLILAGWTLALSVFSRRLDEATLACTLGVMGIVSSGFLLFTLFTSNPFERLLPAAPDGQDLTPLLQDPGMVIHPPMLYMGYVGFVVAFAFAVSALATGRLDAAWARWSRPWTTIAWCFLTCGIALGSFWAYYELGWGGWWFWDPVENASLMPWLAGTALMHSLMVTDKRGAFKAWTALLAITTFSLSLLGTFLVRSGVLTSVHAFAADPKRGVFILVFLALVTGSALTLFACRAPKAGRGACFELVSRESMLLANNALLLAACAAVMLGTLYPLAIDALGLGKLSVGPPYFQAVFVPLMAPALFLMGAGPIARWRQAAAGDLARRLRWALGVSAATALLAPLALGRWTPLVGFGLMLAAWITATCMLNFLERLRAHPSAGWFARARSQSGSYYGMLVAHFGVAVFVVGVTIVGGFAVEKDVRMAPGESVTLGRYSIRFEGVRERKGPNYMAVQATLAVARDGLPLTTLSPERRLYTASGTPMAETAIDHAFTRGIYATLGEPVGPLAWGVRVQYKPFIGWIWGGCLLMAIGGLMAVVDRRRRMVPKAVIDPRTAPSRPTTPTVLARKVQGPT